MPSESEIRTLSIQAGEWWWGGAVADGQLMPFGRAPHRRNLATSAGFADDDHGGANQSAPFLVSSAGRYVWSERPFTFAFDGMGGLELDGQDMVLGEAGGSLASAFRAAAAVHFPASNRTPGELMFTAPQYNTWIEMPYHPTQEAVLDYARGVLDAGFPPGLIMIDDRWSVDYGNWTFDRTRFPRPAEMTQQLHELGFSVMVWLVPFVSPDSENSRMAASKGWLIGGPDGRPVVREWWNGYSTVLDLTHSDAVGWLRGALRELMESDGVDGFKFDAGDLRHYCPDDVTMAGAGAVDQCEAWARLATEYQLQRAACLLEDGRSAALAAVARQATDLGPWRTGLTDPGSHRTRPDRAFLQLPGHGRRWRAQFVPGWVIAGPGALRQVCAVLCAVSHDAVFPGPVACPGRTTPRRRPGRRPDAPGAGALPVDTS